jgi:uncharacterized membrane protein SirB2
VEKLLPIFVVVVAGLSFVFRRQPPSNVQKFFAYVLPFIVIVVLLFYLRKLYAPVFGS